MNDDDFAELFRLPGKPSAEASWEDVGREFQTLGKTLGDAVRAALRGQDSSERAREFQDALQSMLDEVNRAIGGGLTTPEAKQAREQFERVAESMRVAAERTGDELRPELLNLLRQANAELRRITGSGD